jgi:hypothetical protein
VQALAVTVVVPVHPENPEGITQEYVYAVRPPVAVAVNEASTPATSDPEAGFSLVIVTLGSVSTVKEGEVTAVPGLAQVLAPPE